MVNYHWGFWSFSYVFKQFLVWEKQFSYLSLFFVYPRQKHYGSVLSWMRIPYLIFYDSRAPLKFLTMSWSKFTIQNMFLEFSSYRIQMTYVYPLNHSSANSNFILVNFRISDSITLDCIFCLSDYIIWIILIYMCGPFSHKQTLFTNFLLFHSKPL